MNTPCCSMYEKSTQPAGSIVDQADNLSAHEKQYNTLFSRLRSAISIDPDTSADEQHRRLSLTESHGLWCHGRIHVPNKDNLRQDILFWHHDVSWMSHLGIDRTLHMDKAHFYWPHMRADIEQYVSSCVNCQSYKTDRRRRVPSLSPQVPPSSCWRTLGVDLIVDLPRIAGFTAI
jgi:putative transposase